MVVPDSATNLVEWEIIVVNIPWANGLVYGFAAQRLHKTILIFLIVLVVVADEDLGDRNLVYGSTSDRVTDGIMSCQANATVAPTRG